MNSKHLMGWVGAAWLLGIPAVRSQTGPMNSVTREKLCITEGAVRAMPQGGFTVDATKMRGYVNGWTSQAVEARFTYRGPTEETSRLGSGEAREQFGLKLRAQNACNLVYAMWRFTPEPRIVVSVKSNPGEATSAACGNRGYSNLKPTHSASVARVNKGETHVLAAEISGNEMKVTADGRDVWEGDLGPLAASLKGPVGIRSDNAKLDFDLKAGVPHGPHPQFLMACKAGPGVSD